MPKGDRGGKKRICGIRCVAANCGNTNADGFSLHYFPKHDQTLRRKWVNFVKVKRANWSGPTDFSALCSLHFSIDSFPFRHRFEMEQMGRKPKKVKLNEDAFPTIHAMGPSLTDPGPSQAEMTASTSTTPKHTRPARLLMLSPTEEAACQSSPSKKIRRGYAKREAARIITEHTESRNDTPTQGDTSSLDLPTDLPDMSDSLGIEQVDIDYEIHDGQKSTTSIACQINLKPKQRSRYCQTNIGTRTTKPEQSVFMKTTGTQTDFKAEKPAMKDVFQLVRPDYFEPPITRRMSMSSNTSTDEPQSSPYNDDKEDPNFEPPTSPLSPTSPLASDNSDIEEAALNRNRNLKPHEQNKYLVFESSLMELFEICTKCCSPTTPVIAYVNGSLVKIKQNCNHCQYIRTWFSQPFVGGKPAGNLLMSSGILFSGSMPTKVLRMYRFMKVACISSSTFMNHQKYYLHPSIAHVWHNYQKEYISDVKESGRSVVLGGDGRADTPGHSAKYGTYSMVDLDEGVVVDIQLVQCNEVKSSSHMEKEGLMRSVAFFNHNNIKIQTLVTDRHTSIRKWVRENMTETKHCFDVWHVAKGLKKKLFQLSKEKDCDQLQPWIKSLVNHLYWTAASSLGQSGEHMLAKWNSVGNHIINIHTGHSDLYSACEHGELVGRERQKKWLKPGTKVYEKLQGILFSRNMKKDIPMLSPGQQTSDLEGYHSVTNHFAPKMHGFSFHGQLCRTWLTALHFNENCHRDQATTREGQARFNVVYPKFKKGGHTVRKILVDTTYDYVDCLMNTTFSIAKVSHMNEEGVQLYIDVPPPLCSDYDRPDKGVAVQSLLSRFSHCPLGESPCTGHLERQPLS